jgi:peptidoglycan/LPS O-acetylase OafA/YrhL
MPKIIPYLDGWRGLAIIFVLISHFGFQGHSWTGEFGVLLFFVLSGSLMGELLFIKRVRFKDFFFKRFSRVMPLFLVFVTTMAMVNNYVLNASFAVSVSEFVATLLFLRTYLPSDSSIWQAHWPIGHIWSLNIEEHSYIALAAIALLCRYSSRKYLPVVALLTCSALTFLTGLYYASHPPSGASPWVLRTECASFGLICSATFRVIRSNNESWTPHAAAPIIAIFVAVMCFIYSTSYRFEKTLAPLCLAFAIVYLDRAPTILRRFLSLKVLRCFGIWSFSLYMWQQPFFALMGKYKVSPVFMGLGATLVGIISFYAYENRMRDYLNRAWLTRQATLLNGENAPRGQVLHVGEVRVEVSAEVPWER